MKIKIPPSAIGNLFECARWRTQTFKHFRCLSKE